MSMSIEECQNGDVIAEDVLIEWINIPIVFKNTIITDYIRSKLINYNITSIKVIRGIRVLHTHNGKKHKNFIDEYQNLMMEAKTIFNNVINGKNIAEDDLINISNSLISSSEDVINVLEVIHKMRSVDEYTYTHSINVALYAMFIGKWLKMSEPEIKILIKAGILHDIGKTKIPIAILNKPGSLTHDEFSQIKKHPKIGYDLCNKCSGLHEDVKKAVLLHHEREDGSGYPHGLKSQQIDFYAKIIAVADVYDALTSVRVYKSKQTPFDTFKLMIKDGYEKYDIQILNTFLDNLSLYYIGSKVRLSNGKIGDIVFIHPYNLFHPIIKVDDIYLDVNEDLQLKIVELIV